jgi:4-hydroxy-2-oxoheptanedioate aldolase
MVMDAGEFPNEATRAYLEEHNRNCVCIIGIESVPAIDKLENILQVDGIDGIFVGPNDHSITLGIPNQLEHPRYEAALRKIISICAENYTPALIHHHTVALTQKWLREGARFVLHSSDARTLHNGYREEFSAIKGVGEELGRGPIKEVGESKEVI